MWRQANRKWRRTQQSAPEELRERIINLLAASEATDNLLATPTGRQTALHAWD